MLDDIKDFERGYVWKLFLSELEKWEKDILNDLAAPSFSVSEDKMLFSAQDRAMYDEGLRGALKAVQYFKNLPDSIKGALADQEEINNE